MAYGKNGATFVTCERATEEEEEAIPDSNPATLNPNERTISGLQGSHCELRPVLDLPRMQPVEQSLLRLVLLETKVSSRSAVWRFLLRVLSLEPQPNEARGVR